MFLILTTNIDIGRIAERPVVINETWLNIYFTRHEFGFWRCIKKKKKQFDITWKMNKNKSDAL
jgi:hypothetical protein